MLAAIFALLVIPSAVADAPAQFEISGNHRTTQETITSLVGFDPQRPYDAAAMDAAVRALMATGAFEDVRIDRQGGRYHIAVVEAPTINHVTIEGNKSLDKAKIDAAIQIKPRGFFSTARANADANRIVELYRRLGRETSRIDVKTTALAENRVDVVFEVHEGEVRKVLSIGFRGASAFTAAQLRDVITTTEASWLDILKSSSVYDPERLDFDRELLKRYYQTHGFPDAIVAKPVAQLDPTGSGYTVTFQIDEGNRFVMGRSQIDAGVEKTLPQALQRHVVARPGEAFGIQHVDKTVEGMTAALAETGHGQMRVVPKLARDAEHGIINITYRIEDGPRVAVERIDIVGNTWAKQHVIRRELKLEEGSMFNAVLAAKDKARLMRLGLFKSVEITPKPGSASDRVIVELRVEEQENRELSYGLGYSSVQGVMGDVSYTEHNFLGNGQTVRAKVAASEIGYSGELSFTEPHILDSPFAAGFDLFYRDTDSSALSSYKSVKAGGGIRVGYALSDNLSAGLNYSLTRNQIYDVSDMASAIIKDAIPGYPASTSSTYYTSSIGYSLTWDDRNTKKLPTSGSYFALSQDFAGLGGDAQFIRQVADGRIYYPLSDQVTLVGRAVAGNIVGWGGQDVRLLDLFYKGGETVRGFAPAGIGPRDISSSNLDALGGTSFAGATAEARAPLPLVPESAGLKAAVFADAGSLWGTTANAASLPGVAGAAPTLRTSVGAGLVWDSPLGPLRVDYAIPIMKQAFDKTQPLSFGLAPY